MSLKAQVQTPVRAQEIQGTMTIGRSQIENMTKKIKTLHLYLSQTNLKKIRPPSFSSACKHGALSINGEVEIERRLYQIDLYTLCFLLVSLHPGTSESKSTSV